MSLQGKVAIVTGSARGLGAATAVALAKEGANVVINYVSPSSNIHAEGVAKVVQNSSEALVVQADLASIDSLNTLVKKTIERFGKIDILVRIRGYFYLEAVGSITTESYQKTFDVNVRAVIFLSQAVVAHMGDGGRIINVSSTTARQGNPGSLAYSASKAAVEAITRVMAVELRDKGIRVTSVNPGPMSTEMFANLSEETQELVKSAYPVAEPEYIADIIVFLAGPKSRWVNGGTINANNAVVF
ncbi:hypothetical protein M408DRAFT_313669 [Serendipita vermifera MAFF 305830]|uniref:Ketoreductase domain-containing protein n=1 Tax=Serendipita vermifera MAFF 305830 TaxID=933852 RepID=A0A0C2XAR9_SERVB|nr:hypothetical protein M408DRAFT_313669 [Serendipita vermifera MAFF 305830]